MFKRHLLTILAFCAGLPAARALAQYEFFTPRGSFAVEVSLENTAKFRLPIYRNAITSLACQGDFAIGGTSANEGLSPFLFAVSLSKKELVAAFDLAEKIPGQRSIQSGFGRVGDAFYAGTLPDREGESGHLIKVTFDGSRFTVDDLGEAVSGEGVFALTADPDRNKLYGISHPGGKFFSYDIASTAKKVYDEISLTRQHLGYYHSYAV
ncbi:MAG TPA: hypothetical protein VJ417_02235, partial [Candidatus Glassbacteria bacterium]|nr:hypothetical protein [Candidatus Glassbacteria bacterium]